MTEKIRKPIGKRKKLPQFTIMNVIEGQAGLENYSSLFFYSLTIDNILNIIVLLILAGIALNLTIGENGLFTRAQNAANTWQLAEQNEQNAMNSLASWIDENIPKGPEPISETESFVGYYADTDGDNEPDGIIYVDLADTEHTSGRWNNNSWSDWEYTPVTEGLKQYEIISESFTGFGGQWTKPVLKKIDGSEGADRFYVMALEDIDNETHYWWKDAYGKLDSTYNVEKTAIDFTIDNSKPTGLVNTERMMECYKKGEINGTTVSKDENDMWGLIQNEVDRGWFVPSKSEWAAFGTFAYDELGVNTNNYPEYGLSDGYWSSSQNSTSRAYTAYFDLGYFSGGSVRNSFCVRLSTTF